MNWARSVFLSLASALVLSACPDVKPARIEFKAGPDAIVGKATHALAGTIVNAAGKAVEGQSVTYAVVPSEVATVDAAGVVTCRKSGEVSATMAGGGLSAVTSLRCLVPAKLSAKRKVQLTVGLDPESIDISVLDDANKPLDKVPTSTTVEGPSGIVAFENGAARGLKVGSVVLVTRAADLEARTAVEVIEKVVSEPLLIRDGGLSSRTLQTGRYTVEVQAVAGRNGVTLRWVGADCPSQPERQSHRVTCDVANTATLTIENPTAFGLGTTAEGFINIYKMPR